MKIWRLKSREDRRFRSGHPWVYSNELSESPAGLEPGSLVELRDPGGDFLARGYGNPNSLIAFRALSRDPAEGDPLSFEGVYHRISEAAKVRENLGFGSVSHRLFFGEADAFPGLIIDRYILSPKKQVFVVQSHTAGADRVMGLVSELLEKLCRESLNKISWQDSGLIFRNDISVRKLEGLQEELPRVIKSLSGTDLENTMIRVSAISMSSSQGVASMDFAVNLVNGQKTGFFLDQSENIRLAGMLLGDWRPPVKEDNTVRTLRILDLCCYVGQWGSQLARFFKARGFRVEVVAIDASESALEFAKKNVETQGAACEPLQGDVLKDLETLPSQTFDLVVCDPPALIKGRKNIPAGRHAYLQLNTQAVRLLKSKGALISCSCSYLMEEEDFATLLGRAAQRNSIAMRWIGRGGQAPDHPVLAEFQEGRYLKCWVGIAG